MSTPNENVHTVRAVPQVIKDLENADSPSLSTLAGWAHEYYRTNHLNIRQIIDGDLLQVLHAISVSGLLQLMGDEPEVVRIQDSDSDQTMDSSDDEDNSPTSDNDDSDDRDDNREVDSEDPSDSQ